MRVQQCESFVAKTSMSDADDLGTMIGVLGNHSRTQFSEFVDPLLVGGVFGVGIALIIDKSTLAMQYQELMGSHDTGSFPEDVLNVAGERAVLTNRFHSNAIERVMFCS